LALDISDNLEYPEMASRKILVKEPKIVVVSLAGKAGWFIEAK
jgi:hypothetical protein